MVTDEQLASWTRLKIHLVETVQLLDNAKERTAMLKPDERRKVHAEIAAVIADIEENINVIEEMFLCLL